MRIQMQLINVERLPTALMRMGNTSGCERVPIVIRRDGVDPDCAVCTHEGIPDVGVRAIARPVPGAAT